MDIDYYQLQAVHDYNINPQSREIFLFPAEYLALNTENWEEPGVEPTLSSIFIKNLVFLDSISHKPITVHMKTCGGDWHEGMAIYDAIRTSPSYITIINHTHARSMSSLILQAADWRVMRESGCFMIHDGDYADSGTLKTVRSNFQFYDSQTDRMLSVYAERMKEKGKFSRWSVTRIKNMLREKMNEKENVFLSPEETLDWGLADEISGYEN